MASDCILESTWNSAEHRGNAFLSGSQDETMNSHSLLSKKSLSLYISNHLQSSNDEHCLESPQGSNQSVQILLDHQGVESDVEEINSKIEELHDSPDKPNLVAEDQVPTIGSSSLRPIDDPQVKKRGRPRKIVEPVRGKSNAKLERSKTGCQTCRNRKKKCDEERPRCMCPQRLSPRNDFYQ